jgi:TRAP-type C4-dicarboxylate transport system permease large subunit
MDKSDLPDLKQAWKDGWSACLLVLVVMLPFIIDAKCGDFLINVLGETARKNLSSALLCMTPAYAGAYALLAGRKTFKVTVPNLAALVRKTLKGVAPMAMLLWMAYTIGALLDKVDCGTPISNWIMSFNLSYFGATMLIIFVVFLLTMSLSPNAVLPLFGPMIITIFSNYGVDPLVSAAMLIPLFHGLGQISIPYATILYPAMGLADSDFGKTAIQSYIWILGHSVVCALILLGVLPVMF